MLTFEWRVARLYLTSLSSQVNDARTTPRLFLTLAIGREAAALSVDIVHNTTHRVTRQVIATWPRSDLTGHVLLVLYTTTIGTVTIYTNDRQKHTIAIIQRINKMAIQCMVDTWIHRQAVSGCQTRVDPR